MGVLTSDFNTRAGTGTVTMTHSSFPTTTFELSSVGKLGIQFDLESNAEDARHLFFLPSEFTFSCFNQLGDGTYLFNLIDGISTNDSIDVELDFTTDGGISFVDGYTFNKSDVNYNALRRIIEIESIFSINGDLSVGSLFTSYPADVYSVAHPDESVNPTEIFTAMPSSLFIENVLNEANPNGTFVGDGSILHTNPFVDEQYQFMVPEDGTQQPPKDCYTILYRLASYSGSVVGSMFGYNFFINRLDTKEKVTVTSDDVYDYDVGFGISNYKEIITALNNPFATTGGDYENGQGGLDIVHGDLFNKQGSKTLEVLFAPTQVIGSFYHTSDGFFYASKSSYNSTFIDYVSEEAEEGSYTFTMNGNIGGVITEGTFLEIGNGNFHFVSRVAPQSGKVSLYSPLQETIPASAGFASAVNKLTSGISWERENDLTNPKTGGTNLAQNAVKAYSYAYGAQGARKVEFTIFDIDKVMPYKKLETDGSLPEQSLQNKVFSPSEIEYDLETDKVKVKAYDITNA